MADEMGLGKTVSFVVLTYNYQLIGLVAMYNSYVDVA